MGGREIVAVGAAIFTVTILLVTVVMISRWSHDGDRLGVARPVSPRIRASRLAEPSGRPRGRPLPTRTAQNVDLVPTDRPRAAEAPSKSERGGRWFGGWRRERPRGRLPSAVRPAPLPVVVGPSAADPSEPPLQHAIVRCAASSSFFHGECAPGPGGATLTVRGAVLRGIGHAYEGTPGQDVAGVHWHRRGNVLYLAVADGVGSLPRSGDAAMEAVMAALDHGERNTRQRPFDALLPDVFHQVAIRVGDRLAELDSGRTESGGTTLVVAEVRPGSDGAVVTVGGVGDSEAWLLSEHRWTPLHHEREIGEENVTRQLPRHDKPRVRSFAVPRGSVLVLASDGFASALAPEGSSLAGALTDRWITPPTPLAFVSHVGFVDDYYTDDRAAIAVWIG